MVVRTDSRKYPFRSSHNHGFGPFEHLTCGLLPKGRDHSPPEFCFVRSPAFWWFTVLWIFRLLQIGGGVNGWMILTSGMGERLTYGIRARYQVVLVEHVGGLFFDDIWSCAGDSFAGHLGLYCGKSLVVSILVCVWDLVGGLYMGVSFFKCMVYLS